MEVLLTAWLFLATTTFHQRIVPHLQYSIYSPGDPPWPTADGTGAWLADHTAPASALFLPEGSPWPTHSTQPQVLLGAQAAEAGHALMWTDLNGHKLNGIKIRGWNGGIALARDIGANRNPDHIAYTVYVVNPSRDFDRSDPGALKVFAITKSGLRRFRRWSAASRPTMPFASSWALPLRMDSFYSRIPRPRRSSLSM
jgi:hypothetical protein